MGEEQLLELMENICDPEHDDGEWIRKLDLKVNTKGELEGKEQENVGKCKQECATIAESCRRFGLLALMNVLLLICVYF